MPRPEGGADRMCQCARSPGAVEQVGELLADAVVAPLQRLAMRIGDH